MSNNHNDHAHSASSLVSESKNPPARDQAWVHSRTMSMPDIHRLKREWELYQKSADNSHVMEAGKLQIDLLNIRTEPKYKRPLMRIKMGSAQYYSSRSTKWTGDWNEGFIFVVTYHAQLFDTIDFDLYDKPKKHLFAKNLHVAKAKLKISKLQGHDDVFVMFLPLYEYHANRSLPEDVKDTITDTNLLHMAEASGRIMHKKLIGSIQIRIRYHFQRPDEVSVPNPSRGRCFSYNRIEDDDPGNSDLDEQSRIFHLPVAQLVNSRPDVEYNPPAAHNASLSTIASTGGVAPTRRGSTRRKESAADTRNNNSNNNNNNNNNNAAISQHGRGELAQDQRVVDDEFRDRLTHIMSTNVPGSNATLLQQQSPIDNNTNHGNKHNRHQRSLQSTAFFQSLSDRICRCFEPKAKSSNRGQRYGFSQNDSSDHAFWNRPSKEEDDIKEEQLDMKPGKLISKKKGRRRRRDRIKDGATRRARHIIHSVNFGDKNFASQWMQDTFDDVAISHPAFDRLVGLVVSSQTRTLVRSIIKLANAFGQGFKVTSFRLLKGIILLERYYKYVHKPSPGPPVKDPRIIDDGCHYFGYALMAYGWRGLFYLGSYGEFIRQARHRRSNKYAIIRYLQLQSEDLLGYEYGLRKGAVFQPSYFVAIDRTRQAIVLSIRGTWSLYDAITDLVCEYKPFKGGLVHAGMLASAQWFYTNIIPQIFRYIHHHAKELRSFIITGHSLGGGAASLLTMLVSEHLEELRKLSNNPSFQLHCYSYAPVALSSRELNERYDQYIHSFIVQDDVVGRLSYGTAMQLKELLMDTISAYETLGGWYKVMTDPEKRKLCFNILDRRRERIINNNTDQLYPLLYIPGKIVYIRRVRERRFMRVNKYPSRASTIVSWKAISLRRRLGKKAKSKARQVSDKIPGVTRNRFTAHVGSCQLSSEMIITKSCIEDHMLESYQNAFDQLRATHGQPS